MSRTAHEVYDAYVRLQGLDEDSGGTFSTEQEASDDFAKHFLEAQHLQMVELFKAIDKYKSEPEA